ncbi:MAG: hypothetical protein LBU51_04700 [Bacteroidales bacterium]|jgi:hypothetical protein|nr:hypothetical protein [Bacteroidales bacterium]
MKKLFFVISFLSIFLFSINSCTKKTCICGWYLNSQLIGDTEEQELYKNKCSEQSDHRGFPTTEPDSFGVVYELPDDFPRFTCK